MEIVAMAGPLLCHPSAWIRNETIGFVLAIAHKLGLAKAHLLPPACPAAVHQRAHRADQSTDAGARAQTSAHPRRVQLRRLSQPPHSARVLIAWPCGSLLLTPLTLLLLLFGPLPPYPTPSWPAAPTCPPTVVRGPPSMGTLHQQPDTATALRTVATIDSGR